MRIDRSNRDFLRDFVERVNSGEPVPAHLLGTVAGLIGDALESNGRLALASQPGPESDYWLKLERAFNVAMERMENPSLTVREACEIVGMRYGVKGETIRRTAYVPHGKLARTMAGFYSQGPDVLAAMNELAELLQTFRCADGTPLFSTEQTEEISGAVPVPALRHFIAEIENGQLRRDEKMFHRVFLPMFEAGYEIPNI